MGSKIDFSENMEKSFWNWPALLSGDPSWEQKSIQNRSKNGIQDGMQFGTDFFSILVVFGCQVGMGNPHAVIFVEKVSEVPLELWGRAIEKHKRFPNRTNVEFVEVVKKNHIRIRVWERGAGATLACGTGACAAAVTAIAVKECKIPLKVNLPGGDLEIRWAEGESVQMKGPAAEVFRGEYFPS